MAGPFGGSDPFGPFMASRRTPRPEPSVLDDLRGTEVDPDPFGAFLAHRKRDAGREKYDTPFRRGFDYFMEGTPIQDYIGDPIESFLNDKGYGKTAAAVEGVARQLTPVNMAMIGTSVARGAMKAPDLLKAGGNLVPASPQAARSLGMQELLRHADVGFGGLQVGEGAAGTADAIKRGDTREALLSGGLTALGAVGVAAGMRPTRGKVVGEILPPEPRGRAEVLPPDIDVPRSTRLLDGEIVDQAPPGVYQDPIEQFLGGRVGEPKQLYPPGLPSGPDLPPNAGPGKPTPPPPAPVGDGAAATPPVELDGRPGTRTAPVEDPAVTAARKQLRKEGYPPQLIDTILEKLVNGEDAPTFPRVEPKPRPAAPDLVAAEAAPGQPYLGPDARTTPEAYTGPERRARPRTNASADDRLYQQMREKLARGERTGTQSARDDLRRKLDLEKARNDAAAARGETPLPRTAAEGVDSPDAALEGILAADRPAEYPQPDAGRLEPTRSDANRGVGGGPVARPPKGADELVAELVADARKSGFTGSDDELRNLLDGHVQSANELIEDLRAIAREQNPGGRALFEAIAKEGGLRLDPKDPFHGEIAALWEATENGLNVGGYKKGGGVQTSRRLPTADLGGVKHVLRQGSGRSLDELRERLAQDPRWRDQLPDVNALLKLLDDEARAYRNGGDVEMSLADALRGSGVEPGRKWWNTEQDLADVLDTGEVQPRLPGAGYVRNAEVATPEFESPFSLEREAATQTSVQPRLGDVEEAVGVQTSPESRIADLPAVEGPEDAAAVPFPVIDRATEARLPQEVDFSKPQLARVPLADLVATQPTVTRSVVMQKLAQPAADLTELPVGANSRPNRDTVNVFQGRDGKMYLAGGTHRATAAWARGDKDIQAIVYPPKSSQFEGVRAATEARTAEADARLGESRKQFERIQARHEIRDPEKVAALAQSMRESGWQGRPALVVEKDGVQVAWTATHRLEAARQAGIDPQTLVVDGAALERAGYDLDELTGMGKKARIEALRKSGQEDASRLLEDEKQGSLARQNAPPLAAAVDRVPRNVYDFVTRQLGWTKEELAGMSAPEIYRLGRERTKSPNAPARAARPEPIVTKAEGESYDPAKLTSIDDELESFLEHDVPQRQARAEQRREQVIARQGIPADRVNKPDTRQLPAPITKRDALATRAADRANRAQLEEDIEGRVARAGETKSERQSRVALIQSNQRAAAKEMASAFQRGDYKRFSDLVGDAADRFWNRQRKMGTGEPGVRRDDYGDILEGGILPGFSMLGKIAKDPAKYAKLAGEMLANPAIRSLVGAAAGYASGDTTEESLNRALQGAALAALAPSGLRALKKAIILAKDGHAPLPYKDPKSTDISMWRLLYAPSPERTVPELFSEAQRMLDRLQEIYASKGISTEQKVKAESFTKRELAAFFDDAAEEAKAAGLKRKAWYAGAIARRLVGKPTAGEKVIAGFMDPIFGKGADGKSNFNPRTIEQHGRLLTYRTLVGYALDTAAQNLTQPVLSLLHVSPGNLRQGYAAARTEAGRTLTKGLDLLKPTDVHEDILSEAKQLAGKGDTRPARPGSIRDIVTDPGKALRASDNFNRRVVYLAVLQREGALRQALRTGEVPADIDKLARSIVRKTQGGHGPLGNNPFHRGPVAGNLASFQKYPGLFLENVMDAFNDPKTRGRAFVASMMGLVAAGQLMGISTEDLLVSGGRPMGIDPAHPMDSLRRGMRVLPAGRAVGDVMDHATGKANHPFAAAPGNGFLDSDLAQLVMGRYPVKATKAIAETMREGLGQHAPASNRDTRPAHTGVEDLASLVGVKSTREVEARKASAEASRFQRESEDRRASERREAYGELDRAMQSGDAAAIQRARAKLTPSQLRAYDRATRQSPYERRRSRVPAADRPEFDRRFKERLDR